MLGATRGRADDTTGTGVKYIVAPIRVKESNMPNDPGFSRDTCIFMEAVSGDGGAHNGGGVWWLSPDVSLTGATSGPDKADPGQHNTINVTFHRKAAGSNCLFPGAESLTVEVWAGNPSLVMTPNNPASTTRIQI